MINSVQKKFLSVSHILNMRTKPLLKLKRLSIRCLIGFVLPLSINATAQNFQEVNKVVASDRENTDYFGYSVSISGNYAIVGAFVEDEDSLGGNTLSDAGSAYIFEKDTDGKWRQLQKLVSSDRAVDDNFGRAVAISGSYAMVGAYREDEDSFGGNTIAGAGSVYVFEQGPGGYYWEVQKLVASDRGVGDLFGYSLDLSGNRAIIGAYNEDEDTSGGNTLQDAGAAYVFERGANWQEVQKLVASDRGFNDNFGHSVSINGDYAIVGAQNEDHDSIGANTLQSSGSAYMFKFDGNTIWNEVQKLVASDRTISAIFGWSVSISGDFAIVGAKWERTGASGIDTLEAAGSAYVFERDSFDKWIQVQKISHSDRADIDEFGNSVSITGNYVIF